MTSSMFRLCLFTAPFFLLTITTSLTTGQCLTANDNTIVDKNALNNLYTGQQAFTLSLLRAINNTASQENIFFSSYSTYHALLLTYFGSGGSTESELRNVLNLQWANSKVDVQAAYRHETQQRIRRGRNSTITFRAADRIFLSEESQLRDCMKALFNEEYQTLDFKNDPEGSRKFINGLVENVTDNNIKEILIEGSVTQATNLVIANAAFFKGSWASQFDSKDTVKSVFYSSPEKRGFVDMMYKLGTFSHAINERLGCHILEMPYLDENAGISMMIFLPPATPNGLDNVMSRMTPEAFQQALDEGQPREIEVKLPKFTFEKTYQFVPILSEMGLNELFLPSANLTGFSSDTNLNLGEAVHKAKIEVNEEGSTAAAATVLISFRSARPLEPAQFFCDHPFMFFIYSRKSKAILFNGVYRGPE